MAGYTGDEAAARAALSNESPAVRAAGLGALARLDLLKPWELRAALVDPAALVRRRACELAGRPGFAGMGGSSSADAGGADAGGADAGGADVGGADVGGADVGGADVGDALTRALSDPDPSVVEAACYALGELGAADVSGQGESDLAVEEQGAPAGEVLDVRAGEVVGPLATIATSHPEAVCREAAVAALGALGHPDGLRAVLAAMGDKPALRRRAAVALAAFEAPEAELALERAAQDRDWQVRQVAEDLLGRHSERP